MCDDRRWPVRRPNVAHIESQVMRVIVATTYQQLATVVTTTNPPKVRILWARDPLQTVAVIIIITGERMITMRMNCKSLRTRTSKETDVWANGEWMNVWCAIHRSERVNPQRDVVWCCQSLLFLEMLHKAHSGAFPSRYETNKQKNETSNNSTTYCYYYYYILIAIITTVGYAISVYHFCFGFYTLARINRNIPYILPFLSECWRKA